MSLKEEVIKAFKQNDQKFIESFGIITLDPRSPGTQQDKIAALQKCEQAVQAYRLGDKEAIGSWFDSVDDDGKSLLGNVARIIDQNRYRNSMNRHSANKTRLKKVEKMRNSYGQKYGYGYGVDEDLDFDDIFS